MIPRLFAARYDDTDYTGVNPAETFQDIQDVGIRWNILQGGIQRIELTVAARSEMDAYDRYKSHLGHLIAIYDNFVDQPITGNVHEVVKDGRHVHYICAGPFRRTNQYWYKDQFSDVGAGDDISVAVIDILDDIVDISNSDQSNIDTAGIVVGAWTSYRDGVGVPGGDAIHELIASGDSSDNPMDFYFVDAPFSGLQLQKPIPYLKSRSTTSSIDWQFNRDDIARDGLELGRNIWQLKRLVKVGYRHITGVQDGGTSAHIIDADGAFEAKGVSLGDRVWNLNTQNASTVEAFVDPVNDDELDLTNHPAGTEWSNGDRYVIELKQTQWTSQTTDSQTNLWDAQDNISVPALGQVAAEQYRDTLKAIYDEPLLQQSFILSAPWIKDGNGARWGLWRPLMGDSFYFRANDLFPEAALFSTSDDREKAFMAVSMDYTYSDNRLRIVPATEDSRLDVLMAQALAEQRKIRKISEIVSTA